jgi:MFS family permease
MQTTASKMRYLFLGQFVSQVGENIARVALLYYIYRETHSVGAVALTGVLQNLPPLLLSPVTGALFDHHDKRSVLLVLDLFRTLLSLAIPVLYLFHFLTIASVEVIVLLTTVCSGAFGPGLYSFIPSILEKSNPEEILKANSTIQTTGNAGVLIGPLLGGALLTTVAAPLVMGVASVTFLFSVIFLWKIRTTASEESSVFPKKQLSFGKLLGVEGAREIFRSGELMESFAIYAVFGFLIIPLTLLLPELVADRLGSGGMAFGGLLTSFGVGQLAMSVLMSRGLLKKKEQGDKMAPLALLASSGMIFFLGNATNNAEAFFEAFFIGGLLSVIHPVVHAKVFCLTPKSALGSVMSLLSAGFLLLASVGSALLPALTGQLGISRTFEVLGAVSLVSGLFFLAQPVSFFRKQKSQRMLSDHSYPRRIENVYQD